MFRKVALYILVAHRIKDTNFDFDTQTDSFASS